jgi:cytochrome c peroxidase
MSCQNRTLIDVGHKLLTSTTTPLAQQDVSPTDSVLGPLANARLGRTTQGLVTPYSALIAAAFQPRWWQSVRPVATATNGPRVQMEANFSLFWGLAVGAYMDTLRADETRVDRFFDNPRRNPLKPAELRGLKLFESANNERPDPPEKPTKRVPAFLADGRPADLRCTTCHGGPETTGASHDAVFNDARLERMAMPVTSTRTCAIYDAGHFNTGVRRTTDDPGLGARDPFGNALGETQLALDGTLARLVTGATAPFGLVPPIRQTTNCDGANVMGTFKAPQLRNVELTGPYFHNGGQLTLRQVVDFYSRGGDFANTEEFDPNVHVLQLGEQDKADLVAFLMALTDERVAFERAPFDHPSICVANGAMGDEGRVTPGQPLPGSGPGATPRAADQVLCVDAVGASGRPTRLKTFLEVNQFNPNPR